MATYTDITIGEMREYLESKGFREIPLEGMREFVFGKLVRREEPKMTLRVFTGIEVSGGHSRGCGEDAVRVCVVARRADGEVRPVGRSRRVHRVVGWRENLESRLRSWEDLVPLCPQCSGPMAVRTSRRGGEESKFWGCLVYPDCRGTRPGD